MLLHFDLLLLVLIPLAFCDEITFEGSITTEFRLLTSDTLQFSNPLRQNSPHLTFTLYGANVTHVNHQYHQQDYNFWHFNDSHVQSDDALNIWERMEDGNRSVHFEISWFSLKHEEKRDECCFHYGEADW